MNRKGIDELANKPHFSMELFNCSRAAVAAVKQLECGSEHQLYLIRTEQSLRDKHLALERIIKKTLNTFCKLTQVYRNITTGMLGQAVDIFYSVTDLIEASTKRYRYNKASVQGSSSITLVYPYRKRRPQDLNPAIRPAKFTMHTHSNINNRIRDDAMITPSISLTEPLRYIDTLVYFEKMIEYLNQYAELAIDVEHSSQSYEGFTCLIQISTRSTDFIVDVFPLWQDICKLRPLFESNDIIKVFHGAEMDIKWLQRDFNLHIVNLFDTYKAARVLGLQKLSYAYLLNNYCQTITDKQYQLADWRTRPLSKYMLHYARLDTHYLLEIFDKLRKDLYQQAMSLKMSPETVIASVYASSHQVSRIEAELFDYRKKQLYVTQKESMSAEEFAVIDRVFELIDAFAKKEDVAFDDLANNRTMTEIIARIKDMQRETNATNLRIKIERLLGILKQYHKHSPLLLPLLKEKLYEWFITARIKASQSSQAKYKYMTEKIFKVYPQTKKIYAYIKETIYTKERIKNIVHFAEYAHKSYEYSCENSFSGNKTVQFEPIALFLSRRFNIYPTGEKLVKRYPYPIAIEAEYNYYEYKDYYKDEEGIIQFKRMNPNVIYTIEEYPAAKPRYSRKKRKEVYYELRIKSKTGNIFELLYE